MSLRWLIGILILVAIAAGGWLLLRPVVTVPTVSANLITTGGIPDTSGFARVTDPNGMSFPEAFGAHSDYRTEWWYYTGNVQTESGRAFGYQFTLFRRALIADPAARDSAFATSDVYMAHFALTDGEAGEFYDYERFQRGAAETAGAVASPYHVWLDDWEVVEGESGVYTMRAYGDEVAIDFTLEAMKPPARHGNNGVSQKGDDVGNASYYYSQSSLATTGTVTVQGESFAVTGNSWKDHEYGTSVLALNAVGWDWFSLQLSDNTELMFYRIRTADGGIQANSLGSYIREDGSVEILALDNFEAEVLETWNSPATGGTYPVKWRLSLPDNDIELTVTALIPNQEVNLSVRYWEGAVTLEGTKGGVPITGLGYMELTGYDGQPVPSL